jgi:putative hydrolase of the HAD superfamily
MAIRTIFFDVGGTLVHPDLSQLMAPLFACVTPTDEQIKVADRAAKHAAHLDDDRAAAARSSNQGHWDVYFRTLLNEMNGSLEQAGSDKDALLAELVARANNSSFWTKADPMAAPTLEHLRQEYRLAVISNADGRINQVLARAGLVGYFNHITDSGLVGCEKPDPRIFRAALEAEGAEAAESLYIGDIFAVDYQGATGAGLHAVLLDPGGTYCGWDIPRLNSLDELPEWVKSVS